MNFRARKSFSSSCELLSYAREEEDLAGGNTYQDRLQLLMMVETRYCEVQQVELLVDWY